MILESNTIFFCLQIRAAIVGATALYRNSRGRVHDRLPHVAVGHDLGIVPAEVQRQPGRSHDQHRADINIHRDQNVSGPERHRRLGVHDVAIRRGRRARRDLRPGDTAGDPGTKPRRHRDEVLQQARRQLDVRPQDLPQRVAEEHHPPAIHVDLGGEAVECRDERVCLRQFLPGAVPGETGGHQSPRERLDSGSANRNRHRA